MPNSGGNQNYWNRTLAGRFSQLTRAVKATGIVSDITREQHAFLLMKTCEYCGGDLSPTGHGLDKKDSTKGYTNGNVVPCCVACNRIKNRYLTYEEMKAAMQAVLKVRNGSNNGYPEMTLNDYQDKVHETAVYPNQGSVKGFEYCLFGALGELGEIANKYKKILRKEENLYKHREDLMAETGDGLWYLMEMLRELGYSADFAASYNVQKLAARKMAGELKDHK